jgi:LCP family protein required for cell wall assembly
VILLALVAGGVVLSGYLYLNHVNAGLKRTSSMAAMTQGYQRPAPGADGATNILMLGSDSRDPDQPVNVPGNWRSDTIMLLHIPASHDHAYLISFPRDLWVHVPQSQTTPYGDTMAKINSAVAWGGVPLMVRTIEEYSGVRVDHVAVIDFAGFEQVTDALGGIDLYIDQTITSIHPPYRTFPKGMNHLTGAEALDYVRQRKQFPDGDFARMRHQQEFLKAVMDKAVSMGTITNLGALTGFVSAISNAVSVDADFSAPDLAWQLHSLRSKDITFMTLPNLGPGWEGDQSVVLSDHNRALSLFDAVNHDTVAAWLRQPGNTT